MVSPCIISETVRFVEKCVLEEKNKHHCGVAYVK